MLRQPILFQNSSEDTNTLGLGALTGFIDWTVSTDTQMVPKFQMDYKIDNYLSKELKPNRVIMADASDQRKNQLFRITKITGGIDDSGRKIIKVEASAVGGDIIYNSIKEDISLANASPKQLWDALMENLADGVPNYTFETDITTVANVNLEYKRIENLQEVLFGTGSNGTNGTDSFIKLYNGEWVFDNYHLSFKANAGHNQGLVIKYGQNLKTLQQEEAIDNTYTALQAYATQKKKQKPTDYQVDSTNYTGSGLVQYLGAGGLQVFNSPGGQATGQSVQNGQHIELIKQYVDKDNVEWLQMKNGNWIYGKHVVVDKKGAWIANEVVGQGHIKFNISNDGQGGIYETVNGVLVANYIYGQVPIYSQPTDQSVQKGYLDKNIARWKVFLKTKDDNGTTWYDLGSDQWVSSKFVQFDKQSSFTYTPGRGVGTVNHDTKSTAGSNKGNYEGVAIWSMPTMSRPSSVVKYVYHGSRWQIFDVASNNGQTWYNLGGNQWINSQYMKFDSDDRDVKPKTDSDIGNANATAPRYSGYVVVYDHPGWERKPTGKKMYSGDEVNILSQASVSGGTWYEVGTNEWIDGHYVDFGKDTDVDPYDPSKDIVIMPEKEVTLKLPDIYMKAPNADNFEHQKIMKKDLSQYNIDSVKKLEEVARAFIYDNHLGEPTTQLTVSYYQMKGELAELTRADIYDRGIIYYPKLDINVNSEVTHGVWDGAKYRWKELTFGKRPETLRDTLDQYMYNAETNTRAQVSTAQQKMDKSLEIKWTEMHEEVAKQLEEAAKRGIHQEDIDNAIKAYNKGAQDIIQNLRNDIAQKASITGGIMHYEKDRLWSRTNAGGMLQQTSEGIVYTGPDNRSRVAISATGGIAADTIVGNQLTGIDLYSATIHSGTIETLTLSSDGFIRTGDGSNATVMSAQFGFSTPHGLSVSGNTSLNGTNINGGLVVQGTTGSGFPLELYGTYGGNYINFIDHHGNRRALEVYDDGRLIWNGKTVQVG